MKKTYVKPMMESEEFVANEYVATCWVITCLGCQEPGTTDVVNHGSDIIFSNGFPGTNKGVIQDTSILSPSDDLYYKGTINNQEGLSTPSASWILRLLAFLGWGTTDYHPVSIVTGENNGAKNIRPNHPNASA